jgi:hypothetical protein
MREYKYDGNLAGWLSVGDILIDLNGYYCQKDSCKGCRDRPFIQLASYEHAKNR